MRRWTKEARDSRRAAAAEIASSTRAKVAADSIATVSIVDQAETEARRLNAMRLNAATLMLNRAMSEYADEGVRR